MRCTGEFSKAVWIYGGHYVFDDSYKGGGRVVDEYPGPDAVLRRSTIGGFCDSSVDGAAGWGILLWELASLALEDCLVEDCEFIGVSACHASIASVLGCTVQGCRVGGLLVNEEARMTVQVSYVFLVACSMGRSCTDDGALHNVLPYPLPPDETPRMPVTHVCIRFRGTRHHDRVLS